MTLKYLLLEEREKDSRSSRSLAWLSFSWQVSSSVSSKRCWNLAHNHRAVRRMNRSWNWCHKCKCFLFYLLSMILFSSNSSILCVVVVYVCPFHVMRRLSSDQMNPINIEMYRHLNLTSVKIELNLEIEIHSTHNSSLKNTVLTLQFMSPFTSLVVLLIHLSIPFTTLHILKSRSIIFASSFIRMAITFSS